MKIFKNIQLMLVAISIAVVSSCVENTVLPEYDLQGSAYATVVTLAVSNDEPVVGETVEISITYVNYAKDPLSTITFEGEVDGGTKTTISTLDESGAAINAEITHTWNYVVPDAGDVTIYAVLQSQEKEFPQIEKISMEIQ